MVQKMEKRVVQEVDMFLSQLQCVVLVASRRENSRLTPSIPRYNVPLRLELVSFSK